MVELAFVCIYDRLFIYLLVVSLALDSLDASNKHNATNAFQHTSAIFSLLWDTAAFAPYD